MPKVVIWHNPRCSKSRATLSLIEQHGLDPEIIEYLKTPPSADDIKSVLKKLRMRPRDLMRKGEPVYKELALDNDKLTDDQLVKAMAENPILIERPVVIFGQRAKLGRPPEDVLDLFTDM
ncbi:arsenate reductase (glutaredoxin) [Parvibaculum sp.]|uniref:arsenate reductase (glutaredoxin) n=1 Tax=Parvibaculum sp. TaxID=2024848 RepID=UPI002BC8A62F|nr:arsenate reductase (glutaredoxin) [Parvibaculum sp.]HUD53336.1 arsenate reductase (glutaredoxin) [Parvibaculum sp.]